MTKKVLTILVIVGVASSFFFFDAPKASAVANSPTIIASGTISGLTGSITIAAGSNTLLVAWVAGGSGTPSACTYNTTEIMTAGTDFSESQVFSRYFYLKNPTATTANLVCAGAGTGQETLWAEYQYVDQTTPLDGVTPTNGSFSGVTSSSQAITTGTNNATALFMTGLGPAASGITASNGATLQLDGDNGSNEATLLDKVVAVAGASTLGQTWTNAVGGEINMIVLRADGSASGGGATAPVKVPDIIQLF